MILTWRNEINVEAEVCREGRTEISMLKSGE